MQFSTPIGLERGRDVGAFLLVGLDTAPEIDRVVRATQLRLFRLFLPMLLLGILLSSFLARHIARPILLAVENVRRIATGDHGHRLAVAGPAELTILAEGINQMSGEIRQRLTEVADANAKLDRKVYELSVLYDVSKAMNFRSYSPELLTYLLDIILDALNASWGSIMMISENGESLRTRIVRGASWDPDSAVEIPAGTGIAGEVFSTGEPIVSNLGHMDARFAAIPGQSKEFERQIRQMICAPLLVDSKPIGVLNIVNKKDGSEFNDDDRHLLVALAAQAARSLENARLYAETIREPKTGLFIPNYFAARVSEQVANARRFKEEFCVIMVDIDFFKQVNDTYGHLVGDEILLKVARFIKETLRESIDVACRFGGEEFALLLPHTDRAGGLAYAERLRKRTETESPEPGRNLPGVTISLGVATYPQDGGHYTLLVQEADRRLYQSKENGRNRVTA
jgi:diguanylate cyclase (GGDEF)-like protein